MNNNSNKTVEELAREAMAAIKKSEIDNKNREERLIREQILAKEAALKEEAERRIRKKLTLIEKEEKSSKNKDIINTFKVQWENIGNKNINYEGYYDEKLCFKIKRGINLFHLYIKDKELIKENWEKSNYTSINLNSLKEKADKIITRKKEKK